MKVTEICTPNILKYSCDSCDYNTSHKNDFVKHLHTKKHLEQQIGNLNPKNPKKSQLYFCENCDYSTSHKSHFDKHRETLKCISVTKCRKVPKSAEKCRKVPQKLPTSPNQFASATCTNCESIVEYEPEMTGLSPPAMTIFACKCGKEFKTRSGLWRHQKHPTSCTWNKEPEDKPILLGAVKKIAGKNIKQISEWCKQHPNYRDAASRDNDVYLKMLVNVMQGGTDNEINNSFKTVFRNVATGAQIKKH